MDLIRSFIDKTLKSEETALTDYTKYVQQRAQAIIKGATQQVPAAEPQQIEQESEPSA